MPRQKKNPKSITYNRELGERIKYARERRTENYTPMTRQEFSEASGIPIKTLGNYERGEQMPSTDVLKTIVVTLKVDARWMLLGKRRGEK